MNMSNAGSLPRVLQLMQRCGCLRNVLYNKTIIHNHGVNLEPLMNLSSGETTNSISRKFASMRTEAKAVNSHRRI